MKIKNRRWRLIADSQVQGGLCLRLAVYWLCCQMVMAATTFVFFWITGSLEMENWTYLVPAMAVSSCILPFAMYDLLRFSNRFAGPIAKMRRNCEQLANGESIDELELRPRDFYRDLKTSLNHISRELKTLSETAKN